MLELQSVGAPMTTRELDELALLIENELAELLAVALVRAGGAVDLRARARRIVELFAHEEAILCDLICHMSRIAFRSR